MFQRRQPLAYNITSPLRHQHVRLLVEALHMPKALSEPYCLPQSMARPFAATRNYFGREHRLC